MTASILAAAALSLLVAQAPTTTPPDTPPEPAPLVPPSLITAAPPVTGVPGRRGLTRRAVVELTIGFEGVPRDARLIEGPGGAWDAAAVKAALQARFSPARRAGAAVEVRVQLPLTLSEQGVWQGLGRRDIEPVPTIPEGIAGRVTEMGTGRPLVGVPVTIDGLDVTVVTDADGRFEARDLPAGRYFVIVQGIDHDPQELKVGVPTTSLRFRLVPNPARRYRTVVTRSSSNASRIAIPVERAREVPGSSGDPIKVIESLPGVARPAGAGPGTGQLVVRGSAPEDTKFYVDGMPLLQLYHFGGVYSVLADEWIKDIVFFPGGFGADYGDATGGLLSVSLADVPSDGFHGHIDFNVFHVAAMLTVGLPGDWSVGVAFRRSYVDLLLSAILANEPDIGLTTAPRYYDYQVRADWRPSPTTTLRMMLFGTDDALLIALGQPSDDLPASREFGFSRSFHQLQATLSTQLLPGLDLKAGLATSYQQFSLAISPTAQLNITFDPVTMRADLNGRILPELTLSGGIWAEIQRFAVDIQFPLPTKEGEVQLPLAAAETIVAREDGLTGELAAYVQARWAPLDELTIIGGLRVHGWLGLQDDAALDPRLTVHADVAEWTRLTFAAGMNHQSPAPDELSEIFGNPDLTPERAYYTSIGVGQQFGDFLKLEATGFFKYLEDLVTPVATLGAPAYDNAATGYVVGGELLLQLDSEWVDGWISYTLSRSRRTDRAGEAERPFSFDQTHVLAVVAGVNLGAGWRIGTRLRYGTGNPYTPLTTGYFDAESDVYVPRPAGAPLSRRLPDFVQWDLRVDKEVLFDVWRLKFYLEITNVSNQANVEFLDYNFDYSSQENVNGLPIFPSLGVRASW